MFVHLRLMCGWVASALLSCVMGPGSLAAYYPDEEGVRSVECGCVRLLVEACLAESCRQMEGVPSWAGQREAAWGWAMWQVGGALQGWENQWCGEYEALVLLHVAVLCLVRTF